ncbi:MerR family DNA-binding transcriptional regulator [Acidobacteria bacterium AB60]|nr:MerR family DNA-binding transcriptional regulator [Acidobacteria bacterium AB60]
MRIGELAARAEVNIQTLRFYEREGLLRSPVRTASGYRSPALDSGGIEGHRQGAYRGYRRHLSSRSKSCKPIEEIVLDLIPD